MIARRSYSIPRKRDARRQRLNHRLADIGIALIIGVIGVLLAHYTLETISALPILTAPMPGCC